MLYERGYSRLTTQRMTRSVLFSTGEWVVPHSQVSSLHGHGHPGVVEIRSANSFYSFGSLSPSARGVIAGPESGKAQDGEAQTTHRTSIDIDIKGACCFQLQSRAVNSDEQIESTQQVTVDFVDETADQDVAFEGHDDLLNQDIYSPGQDLATFLARPVRIATTTLAQGAAFGVTRYDPWNLFLGNTAISKKLENYRYIRGDLHINVLVNSTPFVYGLYALSYCPVPNAAAIYDVTGSQRASVSEIKTSYTQRPTIYLEPHVNKGGTMRLPFIQPRNFIEIQGTRRTRLGRLDLYPIVSLATAATNTNGCTVSIYAWMENVKLASPTLALQSDEYATGPVSSVATAVAAVGKRLSDVPVIGKFAKATEIGAGATAKIAALFGMSKVPTVDDVAVFRNMTTRGMASSTIADGHEKLSLDPKTELSVDTTVAGFNGGDELNIAQMCARQCVLTTASWQQTDAADALLFHANVSPSMATSASVTYLGASRTVLYDTPMGNISRLFQNWRGNVVFTLKIVASQYHQGRLIVAFDPAGRTATAGTESTVVSKIWDIQECDTMQFKVPFVSSTNWKLVNPNINQDYSVRDGTSITFNDFYHTGRLTVRVGNSLLAPLATANATIVVSVHMEDGEFNNPRHDDTLFTALELQSKEVEMASSTAVNPNLYTVNMGERIQTLRSLMQRSAFYRREKISLSTGANRAIVRHKQYPYFFGYYPNLTAGSNTDSATTLTIPTPATGFERAFWFVDEGPLQYMGSCFVGYRGSIKWTLVGIGLPDQARMIAGRDPRIYSFASFPRTVFANTATSLDTSQTAAGMLSTTAPQWTESGCSISSTTVNPTLEVEIPQYSWMNFEAIGADIPYGDTEIGTRDCLWYYGLDCISAADAVAYIDVYMSAGTDFTMCGFVNVPPRYYLPTLPTPN